MAGLFVTSGVILAIFLCQLPSFAADVVVIVRASAVVDVIGTVLVIVVFVGSGSRQLPNQPHFRHVVVCVVMVSVVSEVVALVVVLSSCVLCQLCFIREKWVNRRELPNSPTSQGFGMSLCALRCCYSKCWYLRCMYLKWWYSKW